MTLSELTLMNKLFWYTLDNNEQERLKQAIKKRFLTNKLSAPCPSKKAM